MKAFVGHSFDKKDMTLINQIIKFLKSSEVLCQTGEESQNKSIAQKVKDRILNSDFFIGIFTCENKILINGEGESYTTSNWVIQESGFAIGNNKELIFLVEDNIYKFPELQGDLEVIYFNRDNLADAFTKLNQMLSFIRSKGKKPKSVEAEEIKGDLEKSEEKEQEEKIQEEFKKGAPFWSFYEALYVQKDFKKAQGIYDSKVRDTLKDEEKELWQAIIYKNDHEAGSKHAFNNLLKHAQKNSKKPDVVTLLAQRYKDMREYQKAKDTFLQIAKLYDIGNNNHKLKVINCYEEASNCLALEGKYDDAYELLLQILHLRELDEHKAGIITSLANVAMLQGDNELFFIFAEWALDLDASDTELRFNLAYRYSKENHNGLSLLHYKKLTESVISPIGLNNQGVQYEILSLKAKSIDSYFDSASHNVTLAMANIAQRYMNEGFIKDAESRIQQANKLSLESVEIHGNVGDAKNRLDNILDEEDKKEKDILVKAEREREFRVKYSKALYCEKNIGKENFEGKWETNRGEIEFKFTEIEGNFMAEQEKEIKGSALLGALLGNSKKDKLYVQSINIKGHLKKMSGKYNINIYNKYDTLPPNQAYEASGYIVMKDDETMEVMEKNKEGELKLSTWKKIK